MADRTARRPAEPGAVTIPRRRVSFRRTARVVWTIGRHAAPAYVRGRRSDRRARTVDAVGQAFVDLGPTFIKLGQMISANPAMFPPAVIEAFAGCQDRCHPQPLEVVRQIVEHDLGRPFDRCFATFEPDPIASGSIAQVHRATTPDGMPVAVKVQRLGLVDLLGRDLALMRFAARAVVRLRPAYGVTNPLGVVEDFRVTLGEELGFRVEAARMDELREVYEGWPIVVPTVVADLTTDRVLTMELVEGIKLNARDELTAAGLDPSRLAEILISSFLYAALQKGVFHGDGHPGNLAALSGDRICLYDFGITGRLADVDRIQVSRFLRAMNLQRFDVLAESLLTLGDLSAENLAAAMVDMEQATIEVFSTDGMALVDLDHAQLLSTFLVLANRHGMALPTDLVLLFKQLLYLNGLACQLEPSLDLFDGERYFEFFAPDDGFEAAAS